MSRAKPLVKKWARKLNKRVRKKLRNQKPETVAVRMPLWSVEPSQEQLIAWYNKTLESLENDEPEAEA